MDIVSVFVIFALIAALAGEFAKAFPMFTLVVVGTIAYLLFS